MKRIAIDQINAVLRRNGLEIRPTGLPDQPEWIKAITARVAPYTMTSPERIASLCHAVEYTIKYDIPGDIVECGVWRGGSMMATALTLLHLGETSRKLHLFDTFEGMSEPTSVDVQAQSGVSAQTMMRAASRADPVWAYAPIDDVRANLESTGYPSANLFFVKGKVEETIPTNAPEQIALLRLDTDWYESTLHELRHLYPRLAGKGALIIDDYGYWQGARQAVDEYIETHAIPLLLARIDETGRIAVKP